MENKSSQGPRIDNGNSSGNPQVTAPSGPGGDVQTGTERPYAVTGSGYEGPGRGSAVRLNSDDQMPCPPTGY